MKYPVISWYTNQAAFHRSPEQLKNDRKNTNINKNKQILQNSNKTLLNQLFARPVSSELMDVQTTITMITAMLKKT